MLVVRVLRPRSFLFLVGWSANRKLAGTVFPEVGMPLQAQTGVHPKSETRDQGASYIERRRPCWCPDNSILVN
jgi:hypothetical protein